MKNLFIVDMQNDFLPGGSLPVPNGDEIIPYINNLLKNKNWKRIYFSMDWHPIDHTSFASIHNVSPFSILNGDTKWPNHCIQNSKGAKINNEILIPINKIKDVHVIFKGFFKDYEQYSGAISYVIDYNHNILKHEITIVGLATDYCVKETAIDLAKVGADITVDLKGCRGVSPETTQKAIEEMKLAGVKIKE